MWIGVIPSWNKTFDVYGDFNSEDLIEGKLYYDPETLKLFYYSKQVTRSNPDVGYFPIWDGVNKYESKLTLDKYFNKDIIKIGVDDIASSIDKDTANNVLYKQRRCNNDSILKPQLVDGDNMFTQCIKGIICTKNITMIDLVEMCEPKLSQKQIENYYSALTKITFMRLDKWNIWIDVILHVSYAVQVYNGTKKLLTYKYPGDIFDTGIVKYDTIIKSSDDSFKKIIKILMVMENITKNTLKSDEIDDYTINNMITTLNGKKALSSQLFSRFIRMAGLSYKVLIYDNDKIIFEYKE